MNVGDRLNIEILRLARGGKAVARLDDGRVVFVDSAAPGELAQVEITKITSRHLEARFIDAVGESPNRRVPPCPHFQSCGGCPWQHVNYSEQVAQKAAILRETLRRGHAWADSDRPAEREFVASPNEWRYRSRITVHSRGNRIGFMRRQSHDFTPVKDCLIAHEGLVEFAHKNQPPGMDRFQVTDSPTGPKLGGSFTQVHLEQNLRLQQRVVEVAMQHVRTHKTKGGVKVCQLLDLYCGNGNLTFPLVESFNRQFPDLAFEAVGVELSSESIAAANAKNSAAPARGLRFEKSDVARWIKRFPSHPDESYFIEIAVLDPPRTGCDPTVIENLARRRPSQLIYVSCDPSTLARDVMRFNEACGRLGLAYRVVEFGGFDMFPQTDHIEAVLVLERKVD